MAINGNDAIIDRSPGNEEVCRALTKWLAMAQAGKVMCVGIVMSDGLGSVMTDMAGANGLEMPMNLGADFLKTRIVSNLVSQQQKPRLVVPAQSIAMP